MCVCTACSAAWLSFWQKCLCSRNKHAEDTTEPVQTAPDRAALSQPSVFFLRFSSLNPFRNPGDQHRQPWELLEPNPTDTQGSSHEEGLSPQGDTDGVPGSPQGMGLPPWAGSAATKPPPHRCSPSSPPTSSLLSSTAPWQLIPGPGEKGCSPLQTPSPSQPRAGWMLAGRHPIPGRTEEPREPLSWGKHARGLREAHLHPPLCQEAPPSWSLPMFVPVGTKSRP